MKESSMVSLCNKADKMSRDSGVEHCVVLMDCGDSRRYCVVDVDYCYSDEFVAFDGSVVYSSLESM